MSLNPEASEFKARFNPTVSSCNPSTDTEAVFNKASSVRSRRTSPSIVYEMDDRLTAASTDMLQSVQSEGGSDPIVRHDTASNEILSAASQLYRGIVTSEENTHPGMLEVIWSACLRLSGYPIPQAWVIDSSVRATFGSISSCTKRRLETLVLLSKNYSGDVYTCDCRAEHGTLQPGSRLHTYIAEVWKTCVSFESGCNGEIERLMAGRTGQHHRSSTSSARGSIDSTAAIWYPPVAASYSTSTSWTGSGPFGSRMSFELTTYSYQASDGLSNVIFGVSSRFGHPFPGGLELPQAREHRNGGSTEGLMFTRDGCTFREILKLLLAESWEGDPLWILSSMVTPQYTNWRIVRDRASSTVKKFAEGIRDIKFLNFIVDSIRTLMELYGYAIEQRMEEAKGNALSRVLWTCTCALERVKRLRAVAEKKDHGYICNCDMRHGFIRGNDRSELTCAREMYEALRQFQEYARKVLSRIDRGQM